MPEREEARGRSFESKGDQRLRNGDPFIALDRYLSAARFGRVEAREKVRIVLSSLFDSELRSEQLPPYYTHSVIIRSLELLGDEGVRTLNSFADRCWDRGLHRSAISAYIAAKNTIALFQRAGVLIQEGDFEHAAIALEQREKLLRRHEGAFDVCATPVRSNKAFSLHLATMCDKALTDLLDKECADAARSPSNERAVLGCLRLLRLIRDADRLLMFAKRAESANALTTRRKRSIIIFRSARSSSCRSRQSVLR